MHNAISVKILDTTNYLHEIFGSFFLIKGSSPQNLLVKIVEAVFHDKKYLIFSNMIPIGWQDIRMLAIKMNLHLINKKLKLDLLFVKGFKCD
jgi:hypothetical protein